MHVIDFTQNKQIKFIFAALIALGSATAFLLYIEERKHRRMKKELLELDKKIKEMQLYKLQNGK